MAERQSNWAGNVTFRADRFHRPSSLEELSTVVAGSEQVRALGTGHSFNRIADTTGDLVSVAGLPPEIDVDAERASVTVAAGVRYGELAVRLQEQGYALHNLGSLPHLSVAGACATGTHGSGISNGSLASKVSALELVTADGETVAVNRETYGESFAGAVVSLGSLGIITRLTLDIEPSFEVRQYVYEDLPRAALEEHFTDVVSSAYSVSLFTDWRSTRINQVWLKQRLDERSAFVPTARWLGASLADGPRHPLPGMSPVNCTQQLGVPGPWHERLPHFRLGFTPSAGEELQSEYLLPRRDAVEAWELLDGIADRIASALQISEIRTIAAEDLWLSPSYGRDTVAFHFTWVKDFAAVGPVLPLIEERLEPLGARPHWGKLFSTAPEAVRGLYDRMPDFQRLRRDLDPTGKFGNEFTARYVNPTRS
ncbi:MAG: FAD-binding protein [Frankiales bacterium]|nr:FAD-binding protein [Frankiales bacterium]